MKVKSRNPQHNRRGRDREYRWNWLNLTLGDGKIGNEIARVGIAKAIYAGDYFQEYRVVVEDERTLKRARRGDTLSVWFRAGGEWTVNPPG